MKMKHIFCIVLTLCCASVFAKTKIVTHEVKGYGTSREQAINNALVQAVAQTRGVGIRSGDYQFGFQSATADIDRDDDTNQKRVEFDAVSIHTEGSLLKTYIEGYVKTYEVLEEKQQDDGKFYVKLKAFVYDYESGDKTHRTKITVMPLKTLQRNYPFGTLILSANEISHGLSQKLSVRISETSKFDVLDREYISDFAHSRNINLSSDSSLEAKAQLGKVLASDYMIVGTISDARLEIKEEISSILGVPVREYKADFVFDYRVIVCATRQVTLADTVRLNLETRELKKLVKKWDRNDMDYKEILDGLITIVANRVTETIIGRIYPIRIARIDTSGHVIINQGGKRITKGLRFEVFSQGNEIFDVDTKMSLGNTETPIATIVIQRVTPSLSYANVVEGDIAKLSDGLICRRKNIGQKKKSGIKSSIQRTPTGGIVLPFD